jgi:hypothetical protein
MRDVGHVAIAVSLDNAVYMKNFRKALEEEWKVSLSHRSELNVSFKESEARVEYPTSLKGWDIVPHSSRCILREENVNYSQPEAHSLFDYPPRVMFEMMSSENSEPCSLQFRVTGMTEAFDFHVPLRGTKHYVAKTSRTTDQPTLNDLMLLKTHAGKDIRIIEESARCYEHIGTSLLNDRRGVRVENIECDAENKREKIMTEIYKKWMKEDPGYSWTTLTECFRACRLISLACDIEQHFGIPSPSESPKDPQLPPSVS